MSLYRSIGKRLFDTAAVTASAPLTIPIGLVVAALVKRKIGSPVLFIQARPGKNEKIFNLYKFRTMTEEVGPDGQLLPDKERLTAFGQFLRSTSLDELPELVNVLKGEMSLVGPRPLLVRYLERYTERQRHRHDVLPGITGLAQISGRNEIEWDTRFDLDLEYIESMSLPVDIAILFKTIAKVVVREGISEDGHATKAEFGLNNEESK